MASCTDWYHLLQCPKSPRYVQPYSGIMDNWSKTKTQFQQITRSLYMTETQKVVCFGDCLRGKAKMVYERLLADFGLLITFEVLIQHLEGKFKGQRPLKIKDLMFTKQSQNESVWEFMQRVIYEGRDLCELPADIQDVFIVDAFVMGLIDENLRKEIIYNFTLNDNSSSPLTLDSIMEFCELYESSRLPLNKNGASRVQSLSATCDTCNSIKFFIASEIPTQPTENTVEAFLSVAALENKTVCSGGEQKSVPLNTEDTSVEVNRHFIFDDGTDIVHKEENTALDIPNSDGISGLKGGLYVSDESVVIRQGRSCSNTCKLFGNLMLHIMLSILLSLHTLWAVSFCHLKIVFQVVLFATCGVMKKLAHRYSQIQRRVTTRGCNVAFNEPMTQFGVPKIGTQIWKSFGDKAQLFRKLVVSAVPIKSYTKLVGIFKEIGPIIMTVYSE